MLDALAALLRTLLYAGLLSCAGVVLAAATLRGVADLDGVAERVMRRGAWLTIICAAASTALLALRLGGDLGEATLSAVFLSSSGAALCLQIAGASLLLATIGDESSKIMRLGNAAIATLSFAFNGHAAAVGFTVGLVAFVHASAAAWWIGSLWLLKSACTHVEPARTSALVRRFSAIAIGIVGALVLAGIVLIAVLVDFERLSALASYAKLLALKVALAAVVLGVALHNKFRLTPRLAGGDAAAADELRRMIGWELAVIAAVLFATAILTTYESPHLPSEQ
jgi:putative copper export protein